MSILSYTDILYVFLTHWLLKVSDTSLCNCWHTAQLAFTSSHSENELLQKINVFEREHDECIPVPISKDTGVRKIITLKVTHCVLLLFTII